MSQPIFHARFQRPFERTLISAVEAVMPSTASRTHRPRRILTWTIGAGITLAAPLDGLVQDLGRRLWLPVRVELRVIALSRVSVCPILRQ